MYIDDDADMGTVVSKTVEAIREGTRHIGKADRSVSEDQAAAIKEAISDLQSMLKAKGY